MRAVAAILLLSVLTAFAFAEELELNADPAQCSACMRIAQKAYHGLGCGATQAEINAYCGTLADECGGLIATMCSGKCTEIGPCSRKNCCNGGWCNCGASHGGAATANAAANGMNTASSGGAATAGSNSATAGASGTGGDTGGSSGGGSSGGGSSGGAFAKKDNIKHPY